MRCKSLILKAIRVLCIVVAILAVNGAVTLIMSSYNSPSIQSRPGNQRKVLTDNKIAHFQVVKKKVVHKPKAPTRKEAVSAVNRHCMDERCTVHLSATSYQEYQMCEATAYKETHIKDSDIPHSCAFRDGRGLDPVGLVSVQGSGNTWVRGLLEKATGICTGAIYCDIALRNRGFVGEGIRDGSVLVVKTHSWHYQWKGAKLEYRIKDNPLYGSAILLIRNPFHAFVAERHRRKLLEQIASNTSDTSHVGEVSMTEFGSNEEWDNLLHRLGRNWESTLVNWLGSAHQLKIPLMVVRYEDLKKDTVEQVIRMLDFLKQDYNRNELAARLEAGFDDFHRHHRNNSTYSHYTNNQRAYVRTVIKSTAKKLQSMKVHYEGLQLYDYLQ